MKSILVLLSVLLCVSLSANEKKKIEVATKIAEATGTNEIKEKFHGFLQSIGKSVFRKHKLPAEIEKEIKKLIDEISDELTEDELQGPLIDYFVQSFSLSELEGIRDFYMSPAGKALLERRNKNNLEASKELKILLKEKGEEFLLRLEADLPKLKRLEEDLKKPK